LSIRRGYNKSCLRKRKIDTGGVYVTRSRKYVGFKL
jgi:hypothetical protein